MSGGILYLSYDGMLEPLGQSQVLAYLERLARDRSIHLLSYEKATDWSRRAERRQLRQRMASAGIHWHPMRYHKRPSALATAWDILRGIVTGLGLIRRHQLAVVHARSYVPAVMALAIKRVTGARFIFDMRGFWADERVDGGLWPRQGVLYRLAKAFERRFLLAADHVVSLTHAAVLEMHGFPYLQERMPEFSVIPTCTDMDKFHPALRQRGEGLVIGYVGSVGTWYLFEETLVCCRALLSLRPDARLLILNRGEHDFIRDKLRNSGIASDRVEVREVAHGEMPSWMARIDLGVFFIKPTYSKLASAPTRLGEYLASGVPCLVNSGVGDVADMVVGERVGVVVNELSSHSCERAARDVLDLLADPEIGTRCRAVAEQRLSLAVGVAAYAALYERLTSRG